MNKILAIKGHPTRGNEVINILKTIGNKFSTLKGDNIHCIYYNLKDDKYVQMSVIQKCNQNNFIVFTLEEFLKKYPYKIGDKVYNIIHNENQIITNIVLDFKENEVAYQTNNNEYVYVNYLQSKTMDNSNDNTKPGLTVNGEKLIAPKGYIIKTATMDDNNLTVEYVKNKTQYPKTYFECCETLKHKLDNDYISGYKDSLLENLQKLLICRDAYWKIAGEEMGLDKPWKPENPAKHYIFVIVNFGGVVRKNEVVSKTVNRILFFPTKEMRDAFFENFKDVIEACKEFL